MRPMNEEQYAKILSDLAANEKEHESYNRRLKEHDEKLEKQSEMLVILERLTNAVNNLTTGMTEIKSTVQSVDRRVAEIEKEPGNNWKKITFEIIKYVVIAAIGAGVGIIIKGA